MNVGKYIAPSNSVRFSRAVRAMQTCRQRGLSAFARFIAYRIQVRYGCYVSPLAIISRTATFPHPTGITIGEGVVIHERVKVYQNVTLGGARVGDWSAGNYPEIGAGTVLFAGAVIVGKIHIGSNCVVGANSVVLRDVPDDCVAVGAPARLIQDKLAPRIGIASTKEKTL